MKVTPSAPKTTITFNTKDKQDSLQLSKWWLADSEKETCQQLLGTVAFLKETQSFRQRQAAVYAKLYGNMSLFSMIGANNSSKMDNTQGLPADRPTFNLIQSAADTVLARITQSRPSPIFLTDNSDYRERRLAKQLNNFILGEFYQTKAYDKATVALRDALVEGTGIIHVFETPDKRVGLERVLLTELLVDPNESVYGEPRQLYRIKLVDRDVLIANFPKYKKILETAAKATVDNSPDASKTVSDLIMVVEAWRLPSSKDSGDGRHTIACSSGVIYDEEYTKDTFPFAFLHYSPRLLGFWAQGLAEQLMGTQLEINSLLFTISRAIRLVGVPRVFIEKGSKVSKSSFNNDVGTIVEFSGTKPLYEVAPCVPQEMYAQLQRVIQYGYQQCGVSAMQASAEKPAGLNSGEAIRSYDDISTDRMNTVSRRYDNFFIDLAYLITDLAKEISERDGKYSTVYPNKDGTKEISLPEMSLIQDPFVIQCFNMSSLPRDPAGRMQKITEMIQAGMITIKEGRRLLDYPDLQQTEKLANSSEERILQMLDKIVEDGEPATADPFLDLDLAKELTVQYYNLYVPAKLEEERAQMLRDFFVQINALQTEAAQPQQPAGIPPQAQAQPLPQSPLVSNANVGAAAA